jgi:hypothetical protein
MSPRGRRLLVFALFSMGCGRGSSKEAAAPTESGGDAALAAEQEPGAPAPATPAPAPADEAPSSTNEEGSVEQAVADFDRARLELSQLLGRDLGTVTESSARAGDGATQAAPPASRAPAADKASRAEAEAPKAKPLKKGDDGCTNVCRAFESLARSAAAVCRLDDGERCRRANAVVSVAQDDAGVKACACKR